MSRRTRRRNRKRHNKTQKISPEQTEQKEQKQLNCSPAVNKSRINTNTCFTPDVLDTIKKAYNKKHSEKQITETDPTRVWWQLKERLDCPKEECWLEQLGDNTMKVRIKKFIFAPKKPPEWKSNPKEWLSNFDIEEVAKQYEYSHPEFKLIGPTTIDFDTRLPEDGGKCVLEDLCKFDLARFIRAKKNKIGIVFNLDDHDESGSHWVSMFIDIDNRFLFYFDSADNRIPPEIWQKKAKSGKPLPLVNRILEQSKKMGMKFEFYNNKGRQHQKTNTECGMYSLFFIITMLTGETPYSDTKMSVQERIDLFKKGNIPDKTVFGYRQLYFND
jgi:hypothetical protein